MQLAGFDYEKAPRKVVQLLPRSRKTETVFATKQLWIAVQNLEANKFPKNLKDTSCGENWNTNI